MAPVNPLICYSVKANSNLTVIKTFLNEGAGLDIVSGGELYRALKAGANPSHIVFAGVGKTHEEIEYAIRQNILFFTVESEPEAVRISKCAKRLRKTARIAFRINPDVDPKTHRYISTGKKENKFGLTPHRALKAYDMASKLPGLKIAGLHIHIGSQILSSRPFSQALSRVSELCIKLKNNHSSFQYIDIGGGIGISYMPSQKPLDLTAFARAILPRLKKLNLSVVMEPGRYLAGNSGILVCRVQYVKDNPIKKFVIADAGMNDLIRPSLYQAHHEILPAKRTNRKIFGDLVGPICESGDFIAVNRPLPYIRENDILAIASAGAYGFSMSSNYNSRPRPAEIMVRGNKPVVIRKRETWEDLIRLETRL